MPQKQRIKTIGYAIREKVLYVNNEKELSFPLHNHHISKVWFKIKMEETENHKPNQISALN